jgi:hypothetical protein
MVNRSLAPYLHAKGHLINWMAYFWALVGRRSAHFAHCTKQTVFAMSTLLPCIAIKTENFQVHSNVDLLKIASN